MKTEKELYDIGTTVYVIDSSSGRYVDERPVFDIAYIGDICEIRISIAGVYYRINNYSNSLFHEDLIYDNKQEALDACKYFNEHVKVSQTLPTEDIKNTVFWRI